MTRARVICAFLMILASLTVSAQFNANGGQLALKEFSMSGFGDDDSSWLLEGQGCTANGLVVAIRNFSLVFNMKSQQKQKKGGFITTDEKGNVKVTLSSSDCSFNTVTHEIKGDAPVQIGLAKNIRITGIGYDVDIGQKVILLRSAVNMTLRLPKGALKKASPSSLLHKQP